MKAHSISNDEGDDRLLSQAAKGDSSAVERLLSKHQTRLERIVRLRLDRRLQGRVGASDVVQEAMIDAARRMSDYARQPTMPFFLWLRYLTTDRLLNTHRQHLGTQKRDAEREVSLYRRPMPEACSVSLAQQLLGQLTSPSQAVVRAELQVMLQDILNTMDPVDREVLVLRNFEQLTTTETAQVLGIKRSTASKRYISALKRLRQAIRSVPGFQDSIEPT